jgi:hypothetical protein
VKNEIHLELINVATAHVLATRLGPPAILAASYLVSDDEVETFREQARKLAEPIKEVQCFVTGPWPPYNFVDLRDLPSQEGRRGKP